MNDPIPLGIGDPAKSDAVWEQLFSTEINLFRPQRKGFNSFKKKKASDLRPHSAPEPSSNIDLAKIHGQHRPQTAASPRRCTATTPGSPGNPSLDIRRLRHGDEAEIHGVQHRPELNGTQCEVIDSTADNSGRVSVRLSGNTGKLMRIKAERLSPMKRMLLGSPNEQWPRTAARTTSAGSLWMSGQPPRQPIDGPFYRRTLLKHGADVALDSEQAAADNGFATYARAQMEHSKDSGSAEGPPKRKRARPRRAQSHAEESLSAIFAETKPSRNRNAPAFTRKQSGSFFKEAQWTET